MTAFHFWRKYKKGSNKEIDRTSWSQGGRSCLHIDKPSGPDPDAEVSNQPLNDIAIVREKETLVVKSEHAGQNLAIVGIPV